MRPPSPGSSDLSLCQAALERRDLKDSILFGLQGSMAGEDLHGEVPSLLKSSA